MSYISVCKQKYVMEGEWAPFVVDGVPVMLVWPDGDRLHAYEGVCPHEQSSFNTNGFNGRLITCMAHGWVFDARTGASLSPSGWQLEEYPLRIENGWIEIDMEVDTDLDTEQN